MYDRDASHALTDQLLADTSDGLDHVAGELANLYRHWLEVGVDARSIDWLAQQIAHLGWWSGRLAGGRSDLFDMPLTPS